MSRHIWVAIAVACALLGGATIASHAPVTAARQLYAQNDSLDSRRESRYKHKSSTEVIELDDTLTEPPPSQKKPSSEAGGATSAMTDEPKPSRGSSTEVIDLTQDPGNASHAASVTNAKPPVESHSSNINSQDDNGATTPEADSSADCDCRHMGSPTSGSVRGGVSLSQSAPANSEGYYYFTGGDAAGSDNCGCECWAIAKVLRVADAWARDPGFTAKMGVGDISKCAKRGADQVQGGYFQGHLSHQNGLDVDVRYLRKDGKEAPLDLAAQGSQNFDRAGTQRLIQHFIDEGATLIFVNRLSGLDGLGVIQRNDHQNHFHVRFPKPKGQ